MDAAAAAASPKKTKVVKSSKPPKKAKAEAPAPGTLRHKHKKSKSSINDSRMSLREARLLFARAGVVPQIGRGTRTELLKITQDVFKALVYECVVIAQANKRITIKPAYAMEGVQAVLKNMKLCA